MRRPMPVAWRTATPEDVLAVIQDGHRFQAELDPEADSDARLDFDSTVAAWREACDLVRWRPLAKALNRWFSVSIDLNVWRTVLEPADERRLRGVCELLAAHAKLPAVTPVGQCSAAATFLSLRALLARNGIPVAELQPSTPLAPVLHHHLSAVVDSLVMFAPGAAPIIQATWSTRAKLAWGLFVAAVCGGLVLYMTGRPLLMLGVWFAAGAVAWLCKAAFRPKYRLGQLQTFGDLARVLRSSVRAAV
jgi:hypothetical protein